MASRAWWGSRQGARLLALLLAVGALLVYRTAAHPTVFPGASASWFAACLGLDTLPATQFVGWRLVGSVVAALPFGTPVGRLNVFSALCGAAGIGLLFALSRATLLVLCFHATTVPARRRKFAATLAGLVAAAALAASVPYWVASTRFLPQTYELLLVLVMAWLLILTATRCRPLPLAAFGFLLGFSVLEWETGLRLAPVLLLLALRAMRMGQLRDARGFAALGSGAMLGLLLYLLLSWHGRQHGWLKSGSFITPLSGFVGMLKPQYRLLLRGWRTDPRMLAVVCFAVLPWFAAAALALWRVDGGPAISSGLLCFVLAGTVVISLVGVTISPWGVYRPLSENELPCTVYLLVAMVAGYLAGQGCLQAGGRLLPESRRPRRPASADDGEASLYPDAAIGRLMAWSMLALVLVVGVVNTAEVRGWHEPLAGRAAAEVTRHLEGRTWVVSDSPIDALVRIYARIAGRRVRIFRDRADTLSDRELRHALEVLRRDPVFRGLDFTPLAAALGTNSSAFVQAWVAADPQIESKLLVLSQPRLWEQAGLVAVPAGIGSTGARDAEGLDLDALLAAHEAFWRDVEQMPAIAPMAPVWLRARRAAVRENIAQTAERLAGLFAAQGRTTEADAILQRARALKEEPQPPLVDEVL